MKKINKLVLISSLVFPLVSCNAAPQVKSIKVIDNNHKYLINEELNPTRLNVAYDDGKTETVDITKDMLMGFDTSSSGKKTVVVSYKGETTRFDITVVDYYLSDIKVKDNYLDTYYKGDKYSDNDATLKLIYSNDSTEEVPITTTMVTSFDTSAVGTSTVGVAYKDLTTTYNIKVEMPSVNTFTIDEDTQSIYFLNDEFEGIKAYVEYANGTSENLMFGKNQVTGFDSSTIGSKILQFSYSGTEYEFEIDVRKTITDFTMDEVQLYEINEELKEQTITVTNYDDTVEQVVVPTSYIEGDFDNTKAGFNKLSLSYGGITKDFSAIIPLVNTYDYKASDFHEFKMEAEDNTYCDFSACSTNSTGDQKFEYGTNASGQSTSNMGTVNDNVFTVSFYSSYEGTYNLQARVQSASSKGGASQDLNSIFKMKINDVDATVKGIAEAGGSGNWVMTDWNTTTIASNVTLIKGLNTIEFTSYGASSTVRVPNIDYFSIVVSAN